MPVLTKLGLNCPKISVDELAERVEGLQLKRGDLSVVYSTSKDAPGEVDAGLDLALLKDDDDDESDGENEVTETYGDQGHEEEEEECIRGIGSWTLEEGTAEDGHYTPKGPIRGRGGDASNSSAPYARPACGSKDRRNDLAAVPMGHFLDNFEGVEFEDFSETTGIPGLPLEQKMPSENQLLITSLDDMFGGHQTGSRIILSNESTNVGFSFLPSNFSVVVDEQNCRIGINVPRKVIPSGCIPPNADIAESMDIHIQLDSKTRRIIKVSAIIEESNDELGQECWVLKAQFLKLEPFTDGSGISALLEGVSDDDLEKAINRVSPKSREELLKTFGPSKDTILNCLCCQEDKPSLRPEILAVTKQLLSSQDPAVRRNVLTKNGIGLTALDYSCITNKTAVARFLAEIFYDMGEDVAGTEENGNSILHMMARKGDEVAETLEMLLKLRLRSEGKIYLSSCTNNKNEMPIHVATSATNGKCHQRTLQLLHQDMPDCLAARAMDGSMPLHYACQFSNDPALIALLLYYNRSVVNARRGDGFTPLHLLASRSDVNNRSVGLIQLDEDIQIRMVNLLLEHGADKGLAVQDSYLPLHLVQTSRTKVKLLLKLKRGSRQTSPSSGSPPSRGYMTNLSAAYGNMSPASCSSGFGSEMSPMMAGSDGYVSGDSSGSPPRNAFVLPQPSPFGNGSLTSGGESDNEDPIQELDAIAEALFQHPAIQAVMGSFPNND